MTLQGLIFGLIGGTALLMYGVDKMGEGLEKASGNVMKKILSILTGRVWSAFFAGIFLTVLVQSSTAITVLTVGFVNSGLMKLPQAVGIIYGANIGTTITAQLMAFSFKFKLTEIALPVIGIGFAITYFAKSKNLKHVGDAIMGFGLMFLGLKILNQGVPFLRESESIRYFFQTYGSNPLIGILLGALATALVHSSSATVGIVMMLGQAGLIDLQTSICLMLGDNIGTCITAQMASLTGNIHARRTAWAHTLYNLFGVIIVAVLLKPFTWMVSYFSPADIGVQIANSHTIFNVLSAVVFLPINKYYVKFLETFIKDRGNKDLKSVHLDKLLLDTPDAALRASVSELIRGADITKGMINDVMECLYTESEKKFDSIHKNEDIINHLQKDISLYMVDISKRPLTDSQSTMVPAVMSSINNIERIGDHVVNLIELTQSKIDKSLVFSNEALSELKDLQSLVIEMYSYAIEALENSDEKLARKAAEIEDQVDLMSDELSKRHLHRLEQSQCSIESGVIFLDVVSHFERIADHIYKICLSITDELQGKQRADKHQTEYTE